MDKLLLLLNIIVWITATGYVAFCILFLILTSPWRDRMGKQILVFMSSLTLALVYALIAHWLDPEIRTIGWIITMSLMGILIWSTVGLLIKYQIKYRRIYAEKLSIQEEGP